MTDIIDLSAEDLADIAPSGHSDVAPARCQYDGCSNIVRKPARGRTPKFCEEHRKSPGTKSASNGRWANADVVQEALTGYLNMLSMGVTLINPADGQIIASGSDNVAKALVDLGRKDKQWRKWLDKIATPGKYGGLVGALAPITIGIMANHGLLPQFLIPGLTPEGVNG